MDRISGGGNGSSTPLTSSLPIAAAAQWQQRNKDNKGGNGSYLSFCAVQVELACALFDVKESIVRLRVAVGVLCEAKARRLALSIKQRPTLKELCLDCKVTREARAVIEAALIANAWWQGVALSFECRVVDREWGLRVEASVRGICHIRQEHRALAWAMAQHARLGGDSPLCGLSLDAMGIIADAAGLLP